jgi:hypothetical protein
MHVRFAKLPWDFGEVTDKIDSSPYSHSPQSPTKTTQSILESFNPTMVAQTPVSIILLGATLQWLIKLFDRTELRGEKTILMLFGSTRQYRETY